MPEPFQSRFNAIRSELAGQILVNDLRAYEKGFLDPLVETIINEFTGQEVIFAYNDFRSAEREYFAKTAIDESVINKELLKPYDSRFLFMHKGPVFNQLVLVSDVYGVNNVESLDGSLSLFSFMQDNIMRQVVSTHKARAFNYLDQEGLHQLVGVLPVDEGAMMRLDSLASMGVVRDHQHYIQTRS